MDAQKTLEIQIGKLVQDYLDKNPTYGVEAEIITNVDITKVGTVKTPIVRLHVYDIE